MTSNGFQSSYANERPPSSTGSGDADMATDPASSSFFMNDYKKHEDLKVMLDGNKDALKLEAMKRIIGMVAKGKDASDLFPAVVKNVVSKNIEVKKLVYVYLTRYAEEQQDLALLSISTFQRALKDPNQLIRASALRVLSSIRVSMIVPIMMLAIKEAVMDMSPYVRKTAAHAIPKLYSMDPEQKDQLIEVIEKLLADKTTLVAGSAIQAFEEVCPERIDLIHKNYRKLCNLLVDVEEWGQVVIINMMTRYCRTQFINPNDQELADENDSKHFYASSESEKEDEDEDDSTPKKKPYLMDVDHRLLLRTCKPLLNSRNAAVVMGVAQLYHHCAPKAEVGTVARALIRLLRGHKEVQYVVLSNIATMSIKRKGMFEPFLKSFYVRSNDPTHVKLLKLEILTNLATETNISTILREFQTYVTSSDKEFAAATIQAIGRCASNIAEITDACLNGLVSLMSNKDETVVGESVVVIKKLLQMQASEHKEIIMHMAKMSDDITVPMARASILWLIGEYSDRVPKIAPDVLRKMAKNFINEEEIVKLQILNLAAKMCITNPKQTKLLCQYVFNLAKYDQNYDIRDRVRFLRQLILPNEKAGALSKHAKKIFLATKPAPVLVSKFKDRDHYQLGTLSHMIDARATGYQELPEWPTEAPDTTVRDVEVTMPWTEGKFTKKKAEKKKSFYSDEDSSPADDSSEVDSSSSDDSSDSSSSSGSGSDSGSDSEDDTSNKEKKKNKKKEKAVKTMLQDAEEKMEEDEDEEEEESSSETSSTSSSSEEDEESESEEEQQPVIENKKAKSKSPSRKTKETKSKPSDLLLDLDDIGGIGGGGGGGPAAVVNSSVDILMPSLAGDLSSLSMNDKQPLMNNTVASPSFVPTKTYDLLNRITGGGLSGVYRFTRTVSIFSPKMTSVEITFTNHSDHPIEGIRLGDKTLPKGMEIQSFTEISALAVGVSTSIIMGINFNDTTQPAKFEICSKEKKMSVQISAPVGELLQAFTMSPNEFNTQQGKLTGMNENTGKVTISEAGKDPRVLHSSVIKVANVLQVPSSEDNVYLYAGKTLANGALLLISIKLTPEQQAIISVNCEKMVIGSMLLKDLKDSISKS